MYNADFIMAASKTFNRPDWAFIASQGASGTAPHGPASVMFPWGGQLVSRSGWMKDSVWGWFDVGPYGSSGHGPRDKLHLSIRMGGVDVLVCERVHIRDECPYVNRTVQTCISVSDALLLSRQTKRKQLAHVYFYYSLYCVSTDTSADCLVL